jgi:mannose-6-phosphate isomerase
MGNGGIRRLEPKLVERVWGRRSLEPWFGQHDSPIGEVWFPVDKTFPLLVKFIFTSDRLSVQVHPGDEYARANENSRGKTEMWHILSAEPDASIALGFREPVEETQLRQAVADGSVEKLLNWVPVKAGDTFLAHAGVVHAIGGGISLCEIQQNSDITYRLYDYGRPRELHLEKGLAVSDKGVYEGRREMPVECDYFRTERIAIRTHRTLEAASCDSLIITLDGIGTISGHPFGPGEVWLIPGGTAATIDSDPAQVLLVGQAILPAAAF